MKKRLQALLLALCLTLGTISAGCGGKQDNNAAGTENAAATETEKTASVEDSAMAKANAGELNIIDDKYRTYYEVFLYSFYDSDGDGIGDIQGLIDKLDYINDGDDSTDTDLGCNGIWLMPIMPSPTYHKYDISDYENIDEQYGTIDDFKQLIEACHKRGIRVIIDFPINHTSSKHPWFTQAVEYLEGLSDGQQPDSSVCPYVDYYNFTTDQLSSVYYKAGSSNWYYEGKFWSEMPDLNLDCEAVRAEFDEITSFWMDLGVDGFRMDAAKEYFSDNTTENVEVLKWFNDMVKAKDEDSYIVAEVWTDRETYAKYLESGIDSVFNFDFGDGDGIIANAVKGSSESGAKGYANVCGKMDELLSQYNENYIDAPFYTNHDMARGAGYYSGEYKAAQIKTAGAMNLMMSGNVFLYYGEEIGMKGSGKDENKRAPMQWSSDASAEGMCKGPDGMESIKMTNGSLEDQQDDPDSIYNYFKQAIRLRNRYPEIARGIAANVENLSDKNIAAITKTYDGKTTLLVFNLSQETQKVDISGVDLGGEGTIGGMLLTGEDTITLDNNELTLPSYSMALITVE